MCVHIVEKNLSEKQLVDATKWLNTENITKFAAGYLVSGKNPCDFCNNAYYVYGCEFDCKHKMDCQYRNGYKHFDGKDINYGIRN